MHKGFDRKKVDIFFWKPGAANISYTMHIYSYINDNSIKQY